MDFSAYKGSLELWFLDRKQEEFPKGTTDYVAYYRTIIDKLKPIQKQVNAGADFTDDTSLTWHDESHIKRVIEQISKLLSYTEAKLSPFEAFNLLVAAQIHDIKNIEGREEHENRAISIFDDLGITGIIDSRIVRNIGFIASCHAGSYIWLEKKEKDKIGTLLQSNLYTGDSKIRPQFLAALLRLADEYADDSVRAMSFLLKTGKIKQGSIIHQKHAESLHDVEIEANTGIVTFDYEFSIDSAITKFPKYLKHLEAVQDSFLLDEIFERTIKSHFETVYCMRFLRPHISINKIIVSIVIANKDIKRPLKIDYELVEKGYPNESLNIIDLCGEKIKYNGGHWSGQNLSDYITTENLL